MKTYCNVCNKYKKFKDSKIPYIFEKTLDHSIEILKFLDLVTNVGKYQKIYNHVCRKHKSII